MTSARADAFFKELLLEMIAGFGVAVVTGVFTFEGDLSMRRIQRFTPPRCVMLSKPIGMANEVCKRKGGHVTIRGLSISLRY